MGGGHVLLKFVAGLVYVVENDDFAIFLPVFFFGRAKMLKMGGPDPGVPSFCTFGGGALPS